MHDSAWSKGLTVEVDGHGVVSHTGSAALRLIADNTGLTGGLSRALARRGFVPVHDRGRVLTDLAVCENDNPIWPHCDGLIWPHPGSCGDGRRHRE